jgi:hypothetical protein
MKEKLRVTATVWDNLPESNRQQLMVILGEMAYNAVKSVHTGRRKIDGYHTNDFSFHARLPSWENRATSP